MTKPLWVPDTDHLSLLQRAHPVVIARLRSLPLEQRATTIVNAEKQLRGRFAMIGRARQTAKWVTAYNAFQATLSDLMPLQLLPFNNAAASEFLRLKSALRQIGTQDLRIAAIVLSVGGILVTRNQRDFARVPDLVVADWTQP